MKTNSLLLLFVVALLFSFKAKAQQIIEHKKTMYIDENNNLYQHVDLPVYVFISNTPNKEDAVGMSKTHHTDKKNVSEPCYLDGPGLHTIRHQDEIEHEVVKYFVAADAAAPVSTANFLNAPKYKAGGVQFYGKGLSVELSTKDDMSGVNKFYQSVNGAAYAEYKATLDFASEQQHVLKFYAADNVGNMEKVKEYNFTVDLSAPTTVHRIDGLAQDDIISKYTKVYLDKEDKLSGVKKTFYTIDGGTERLYTGGALPTSTLADGNHTITYYSTDHVENKEEVKTYTFYLDKDAPLTDTRIVGDQHAHGGSTYVSGRTQIELSAKDNKSGVKEILYSVNGGEYQTYTDLIPVPQKGGLSSFRYTSIDNMTNKGAGKLNTKSLKVYVDLKPPAISHRFKGKLFRTRDTVFIRSDTDILLFASDKEGGVQKIGYKLDQAAEQVYGAKINVEKEGMHNIEYTGYDNVNNSQTKDFSFIVDDNGPIIYEHFSILPLREEDGVPVYSPHVMIFLAATDGLTGNKTIYYRLNNGPQKVYKSNISLLSRGKEYTVLVEASDQLGNKTEKTFKFRTEP